MCRNEKASPAPHIHSLERTTPGELSNWQSGYWNFSLFLSHSATRALEWQKDTSSTGKPPIKDFGKDADTGWLPPLESLTPR